MKHTWLLTLVAQLITAYNSAQQNQKTVSQLWFFLISHEDTTTPLGKAKRDACDPFLELMEDHSKPNLILHLCHSFESFLKKLPNMVGNLKIQAWIYSLPVDSHFFSYQCHLLRNAFPCWRLFLGFNFRHSQPLFSLTKRAMYFRLTEYRHSFFLTSWIIFSKPISLRIWWCS